MLPSNVDFHYHGSNCYSKSYKLRQGWRAIELHSNILVRAKHVHTLPQVTYLAPGGEQVADVGEYPIHCMPHCGGVGPVDVSLVWHTLLQGGHIDLRSLAIIQVINLDLSTSQLPGCVDILIQEPLRIDILPPEECILYQIDYSDWKAHLSPIL